ncbi:hypothetical protein [Paenibacillus puerhi]|uniref:hypothetical protein n=1 Tax=Paenibacillus puerhi TaxID=2692622 RepID=UPI00135AB179|nr:hypothetical protein [Paenibacillus puerhi]
MKQTLDCESIVFQLGISKEQYELWKMSNLKTEHLSKTNPEPVFDNPYRSGCPDDSGILAYRPYR